jgi:ubiquitin-protein ligase
MDALVRTVSNKDGGEVTDAEENYRTTTQRSIGEQRVVSGSSHVIEGTQEVASNLVVADEIPEEIVDNEEEEEEDDYEYEDDDDAAFSGFLVDNPAIAVATVESAEPATIEEEEVPKPKWRQPSEQAVNMSLRAEKETTGGKRRLAQDLYRIMNQDTEEAGFSLKPSSEDCMDKWTIQLFQFDEDSKLAKDMKVLGLSNIELEMSFPDQYPFEPPFVRVTRPRFKRQTGFVMNGALCMELLTKVCGFLGASCLYFRISVL